MKNKLLLLSFSFCVFLFASCSRIIGYGVVLWNESEHSISDGTVVPVYLKSNISKVYVIRVPKTREKIEVPLWQVSSPTSKLKAKKLAAFYSEYSGKYAFCMLDGLPIRSDKTNTSKQVYRLRKNEIVRILYKGEGVAPENGGVPLPGEWLHVFTNNGAEGWCFSYNLRLFEMGKDNTLDENYNVGEVREADKVLEDILLTRWYPDYYARMILDQMIDLDYFVPGFGFDSGYNSGTIRISLPGLNVSFPYSEFTKTKSGNYKAENSPIEIIPRGEDNIIVRYTDSSGKPRTYGFISLENGIKIEEEISSEKRRRENALKAIQSLGPDFKSGNYGTLSFDGKDGFRWKGFSHLVPAVIPIGARGSGTIEIKYFPDKKLMADWEGVLTFYFDNVDKEVNFLFKKEEGALRLAYANTTVYFDENTGRSYTSVSLPSNTIVLFFHK